MNNNTNTNPPTRRALQAYDVRLHSIGADPDPILRVLAYSRPEALRKGADAIERGYQWCRQLSAERAD
ncbi:unnamed protein product [marine sediment metagenome]|uniref:Uncharacterized protein n=1 Tax=marine sediment metagenome TaxID=412755 RepID=X1CSU6_9ZZZZ